MSYPDNASAMAALRAAVPAIDPYTSLRHVFDVPKHLQGEVILAACRLKVPIKAVRNGAWVRGVCTFAINLQPEEQTT